MILTKGLATGISNSKFRLRVSKLDQLEAILMARTGYPIMLARTSEILGFKIGVATKMTMEGVVCVLNLF